MCEEALEKAGRARCSRQVFIGVERRGGHRVTNTAEVTTAQAGTEPLLPGGMGSTGNSPSKPLCSPQANPEAGRGWLCPGTRRAIHPCSHPEQGRGSPVSQQHPQSPEPRTLCQTQLQATGFAGEEGAQAAYGALSSSSDRGEQLLRTLAPSADAAGAGRSTLHTCSGSALTFPQAPSQPWPGPLSLSHHGVHYERCGDYTAALATLQITLQLNLTGTTLRRRRARSADSEDSWPWRTLTRSSAAVGTTWRQQAPAGACSASTKRIQQVSTGTLRDTRQEASLPLHRAKPEPPAPPAPSLHTQLKLQLVNNLTSDCTVSPSEPVRQVGHPWSLGKG